MSSNVYLVTMADGESFSMSFDPTQASAPILVDFGSDYEPVWQNTPMQTADVRDERDAAARVAMYFDLPSHVETVTVV